MSEARKIVCHAPGDTCLGCGHYRGDLPACEHKRDKPFDDGETLGAKLNRVAALIRRLEAENERIRDEMREAWNNVVVAANTEICRLSAENAAQAKRIAKLEEAVRPFAEAEKAHGRHVASGRSGLAPSNWTTYDDFRQARAALGGDNGQS